VDGGDFDELLVAGSNQPWRRWVILAVITAAVASGVLIARMNLDSTSDPDARTSSPTVVAHRPVIPRFTDSPLSSVKVEIPSACSPTATCIPASTPSRVSVAITAAVQQAFGRPTDLRVSGLTRSAPDGKPEGLVSRTITADVAAGRLEILLSVSLDDPPASFGSIANTGCAHFSDGYIVDFYVRATLAQKGTGCSSAPSSALERLAKDTRLIDR
jgi:hypothetical protein